MLLHVPLRGCLPGLTAKFSSSLPALQRRAALVPSGPGVLCARAVFLRRRTHPNGKEQIMSHISSRNSPHNDARRIPQTSKFILPADAVAIGIALLLAALVRLNLLPRIGW
jgi:hypothetical protein